MNGLNGLLNKEEESFQIRKMQIDVVPILYICLMLQVHLCQRTGKGTGEAGTL